MKAVGIVRKIDDLGRVVIPKEIRRSMDIRDGEPLEIYTEEDGQIVLQKYSPVRARQQLAQQLAKALHSVTGRIVLVADSNRVVAVSGEENTDMLQRPLQGALSYCVQEGESINSAEAASSEYDSSLLGQGEHDSYPLFYATPIIVQDQVVGAVALADRDPDRLLHSDDIAACRTTSASLKRVVDF